VSGLALGTKAPNFTLKDAAGKTIDLSEELEKGPVILTFYQQKLLEFLVGKNKEKEYYIF
jgi:peroxiredoxin